MGRDYREESTIMKPWTILRFITSHQIAYIIKSVRHYHDLIEDKKNSQVAEGLSVYQLTEELRILKGLRYLLSAYYRKQSKLEGN